MRVGSWTVRTAASLAIVFGAPFAAAAQQEATLKGGVAISSLTGSDFWDDNLVTSVFGGGVRFRLGFLTLQPELFVVTKGAEASATSIPQIDEEQLRLEYIEVPVLVVLPARFGDIEVNAFGGPTLMLESRCRYIVRDQQGLRTNFPCEGLGEPVFRRNTFDFGATAGAGISHRIGAGRLGIEARHTWGIRDVNSDAAFGDIRNRTMMLLLGYSIGWAGDQ